MTNPPERGSSIFALLRRESEDRTRERFDPSEDFLFRPRAGKIFVRGQDHLALARAEAHGAGRRGRKRVRKQRGLLLAGAEALDLAVRTRRTKARPIRRPTAVTKLSGLSAERL